MKGTGHDLRHLEVAGADSEPLEICAVCHAAPQKQKPESIWQPPVAHQWVSAQALSLVAFGTKLGAGVGESSRRCISCHDGTLGIAGAKSGHRLALVGVAENRRAVVASSSMSSSDHPVSVRYPADDNDPGDYNGAGSSGYVSEYVPVEVVLAAGKVRLFRDAKNPEVYGIECGSCHEPHDSGNSYFLRETLNNSALCLACHVK